MWYFADFNILIRKIILNKFQFQPQSVLNLFLFSFWAISASVFLLSLFLLKKKSVFSSTNFLKFYIQFYFILFLSLPESVC